MGSFGICGFAETFIGKVPVWRFTPANVEGDNTIQRPSCNTCTGEKKDK
jgi:hypothetical protein